MTEKYNNKYTYLVHVVSQLPHYITFYTIISTLHPSWYINTELIIKLEHIFILNLNFIVLNQMTLVHFIFSMCCKDLDLMMQHLPTEPSAIGEAEFLSYLA